MTNKTTRIRFTLNELLINIAAVAISAALLSPAVTAACSKAQAATMQQTASALAPYVKAPAEWPSPTGASFGDGVGFVVGAIAMEMMSRFPAQNEKPGDSEDYQAAHRPMAAVRPQVVLAQFHPH